MPKQYKIAQKTNKNVHYYSFPGVFSNDNKKVLKFAFPPVLHLAGLLEVGHRDLEIVRENDNESIFS
jgi:hypothetical protein